ncbi:MAG: ribosome-binding factor A [Alphaproteobacteria bacterium RIFOXYD12_FULL_60_8]|nr:MAG: ribosome-binding factor A [Alphaproteobacteria bacterium RIFOXYD12_FULL_60_8]
MAKNIPKGPSQRQLRVGEEIRHVLAQVLEREEFRDPGLQGVRLTVTEVRVSPDLINATAFVVPLGGGDMTPILEGLKRVNSFLRREVSHAVRLRAAPNLFFEADRTFDEASHINELLHRPEVARDLK